MAERAHAPYNFVRQSKLVLPYADVSELPAHDELRPDLKTGEILVTLRAETPVFVSEGKQERGELRFFRGEDGRPAIPGSTVRGLLRENMQILGFGLLAPGEDLEDYQIYYRKIADAKNSVSSPLKEHYHTVLGTETKPIQTASGKRGSVSVPHRVRGGWLATEQGRLLIYPSATKEVEKGYLRVSRSHPDAQRFGSFHARTVSVRYHAEGGRVKYLAPEGEGAENLPRGALLYTGRPVRNNNALYLFPEPEQGDPIPIPEQDRDAYLIDLESRRNNLRGLLKKAKDENRAEKREAKDWLRFWELPGEGERKPVFYAEFDGHLYFGMSLFLRVGFSHSISEGLPQSFLDTLRKIDVPLDYPHAILGFAKDRRSYRSRVSVGDFPAVGNAREGDPVRATLGSPKPSYYAGYVVDGKDYEQDDFKLRGVKQYWLREPDAGRVSDGNDLIDTVFRPLKKGTEFRGVIRFRNLNERELGLLLWCLRLEEGCFQTIGMGKPLGYGRMKLTIGRVRELDQDALYSADLAGAVWKDVTDLTDDYIRSYQASCAAPPKKKGKKAKSILTRGELKDFFFMKSAVMSGADASYMTLDEYKETQKLGSCLPTVEALRNEAEQREQKKQTYTIEDLKKRFGKL